LSYSHQPMRPEHAATPRAIFRIRIYLTELLDDQVEPVVLLKFSVALLKPEMFNDILSLI